MTLQIFCRALEDVCLCHYLHVLFCLSMQDHKITLQVGVCVSASEYVFLYVRTYVHRAWVHFCISVYLCAGSTLCTRDMRKVMRVKSLCCQLKSTRNVTE